MSGGSRVTGRQATSASARRLSRRAALRLAASTPALAATLTADPAHAAEAGLVSAIRGRVTATRAGATRDLHQGAVVQLGDSVRTHEGARLELTLIDESTVSLGERSQLVVTTVVIRPEAGGSLVFDLLSGIVRAVLGPQLRDIFAVRGRVAVAAARSTDFIVETTARKTDVFVQLGAVAVSQVYGTGEVVLQPGEGIDVIRGQPLRPVVRWGQSRIDDVMARTSMDG
jgi:ferric-dicitrate binding protein FerR (iron transport regulator)